MKKYVWLTAGLLLLAHTNRAQDTLVKRSGEEIAVKVLKITPTEVEYKRFDNLDGPLIVTLKSQVALIRYANGTKEEFPLSVVEPVNSPGNVIQGISSKPPAGYPSIGQSRLGNEDLFMRGQQDARLYYKGSAALWGTAVPTFLYFPVGLPIGLAIAATKPRPSNFTTPNPELLKEPLYIKGYQQQAHRRKIGKAAMGVGIAAGAWVVLSLVIIGSLGP
jgi:hypothetical protein